MYVWIDDVLTDTIETEDLINNFYDRMSSQIAEFEGILRAKLGI
jgi:hypothetical protein